MNAQINTLSKQLEECRNELLWWKKRCQALENDVVAEKSARETAIKELQVMKMQTQADSVPGGCENCSSSRCQCIDDAFDMANVGRRQDESSIAKRPNSPQQDVPDKRQRADPNIKIEPEELEIDFTTRFSIRRPSRNEGDAISPIVLFDPCGFCTDGTPCICAEMAADRKKILEKERLQDASNRLVQMQSFTPFTPPPSDGDVFAEAFPSLTNKPNPCANGPGTCAQCLADPKRTLFCKSLAASRSASAGSGTGAGEGCCGGSGMQDGCCRSRTSTRNETANGALKDNPPSTPPITLSCADTFTTLSRHPNFSRASDELSTWLPRLHTLPVPPGMSSSVASRPAMEVEAASVMGVLRYFDRRFAN